MAKNINYKYTMRELTELLIKQEGLTKGKWMMSVEFGISATNAGIDSDHLTPAALIPIISIGLVESQGEHNLVVDASTI